MTQMNKRTKQHNMQSNKKFKLLYYTAPKLDYTIHAIQAK
jgi:hypothetical protein